jgi:hypothetical protein
MIHELREKVQECIEHASKKKSQKVPKRRSEPEGSSGVGLLKPTSPENKVQKIYFQSEINVRVCCPREDLHHAKTMQKIT